MKKIMFNDKFGLTKAVIEGRKTQTRRLIKCRKTFKGEWVAGFNIHIRPSDKKVVGLPCMYDADESERYCQNTMLAKWLPWHRVCAMYMPSGI